MATISFRLARANYLAAVRQQTGFLWPPHRSFYLCLLVYVAATAVGIAALAPRAGPVYLAVAPLGIFGGIAFFAYVVIPRRAHVMYSQQKELHEPIEYEATDHSLKVRTIFGASERPWSSFTKWAENGDIMLLYQTDAMMTVLPKDEPPGRALAEQIRSILSGQQIPHHLPADPFRALTFLGLLWIGFLLTILLGIYP